MPIRTCKRALFCHLKNLKTEWLIVIILGAKARANACLNVFISGLLSAFCALIISIVFINLFFFPHCNRINRDCFVIQYAWGASR